MYHIIKKEGLHSFDYDHYHDQKENFVTRFKQHGLQLEIVDYSIKEPIFENWEKRARENIKEAGFIIVILGMAHIQLTVSPCPAK